MSIKSNLRRLLSLFLTFIMVAGLLPSTLSAAEGNVSVYVTLENTTYPDGAWNGVKLDRYEVEVPAGASIMEATVQAFTDNGIEEEGSEGNYIYDIDGLAAFDGSSESGWMITLNDWFINAGAGDFIVENDDEIKWAFTLNGLGEDLGGSFNNNNTSLQSLAFSEGVLTPEFDPATFVYTLTIPETVSNLTVTPTALNKNFQVRTKVDGMEYKSKQDIPVSAGTLIKIGCGDPSWPSMNMGSELTEYTITVANEVREPDNLSILLDPIDVTVRVEGYDMTIAPKTDVSVTNFNLSEHGLTVSGLAGDTITPLHALVQLLSDMGLDPKELGADAIAVTSSGTLKSIAGLANSQDGYRYWMYSVNGEMPAGDKALTSQYALSDGDVVTFFYVDWMYAYQSWFDAEEKTAVAGQPVAFTLTGLNIMDWMWSPGYDATEAIEGAELFVTDGANIVSADMPTGILTDASGKANLIFSQPGTYIVSAVRMSEYDDEAVDISRPYCLVTVEEASVQPPVTLPELPSDWTNARGNRQNMGVVKAFTPRTSGEAVEKWSNKYGSGYFNTPNTPVIVDGSLIFSAGATLFKVNKETGEVLASTAMTAGPSFNITSITYGGGMVFAPTSNGRIQAFNADTLESLWISEPMGGQSLSPIVYADGYVYTGYWQSETADNYYVCLSVTDEDTNQATETKNVLWKHKAKGGYYWAGGIVMGNYIIFGSDNGESLKEAASRLYSLNRFTGEQMDTLEGIIGDQRSGIAYDTSTDRLYFTTKAGYVGSVKLNEATGKFVTGSLVTKQLVTNWEATGTPVVHDGIVFVGTGKGVGGGGVLVAADAETLEVIDSADLIAYPQGSPLLSTAYEKTAGKLYLYINYNKTPGGITVAEYDKTTATLSASELYTPPSGKQQYCIDSVISDTDGTLYYHNDSANLFAIGRIAPDPTLTFDVAPADAVVSLYDNTGARVFPDADGKFDNLTENGVYTYTVSKSGYIAQKGSFTYTGAQTITLSLDRVPESEIHDLGGDWPSFRGNSQNMGITSARTPLSAEEAQLVWEYKPQSYASGQIIAGNAVVFVSGAKIYKVDKDTGTLIKSADMAGAASFSIVPVTYGGGMLFANINNGRIQAFNAETLESLWISEPMGDQALCPITYYDGHIYAGFWKSETANQSYVCIPTADENPLSSNETKLVQWKHTVPGGFYWVGGIVQGNSIVFGSDDGTSGTSGPSKLFSLNRLTGVMIDSLDIIGDQRSGISYDAESGRLFFTTKAGYICSVKQNADGSFDKATFRSKQFEAGWQATSTPVSHKGRVYYGVGKGFGTGKIVVADAETLETFYDSGDFIKGYPQGSVLLSTAYENSTGKVYIYGTYNNSPGGLFMLEDSEGQTQVKYTEIFTPQRKQYCLSSPICDSEGNIYYHNDSGYIFKIKAARPEPVVIGKTYISVKNTTYEGHTSYGALLERKQVSIYEGDTANKLIARVLKENGIAYTGLDMGVLSTIDGLGMAGDNPMSGWLLYLNGWFALDADLVGAVKDMDEIEILYSMDKGKDLGGLAWWDGDVSDTSLKKLEVSAGTITPSFNGSIKDYTLTIPYGTKSVHITPTAANNFYQVRTFASDVFYQRNAAIPLADGNMIRIICGDPEWPSVNSPEYGYSPEKTVYTISVKVENTESAELLTNIRLERNGTNIAMTADGTNRYKATVNHAYDSVDVVPVVVSGAAVKVNGLPLNGQGKANIALPSGATTAISIVATKGAITETKTISVTREAESGSGPEEPTVPGNTVGYVDVVIKNNTFPGGAFTGTIVSERNFAVGSNDTMMTIVLRVLAKNGYGWTGAGGTKPNGVDDYDIAYLASITKNGKSLGEFDGDPGSGWMGLLNDWFVNEGFQQFKPVNGDDISIEYTQDRGVDLGGTWGNSDTSLRSLSIDKGTLSPSFSSSAKEYTLKLPAGATSLRVTPSATNRNYLTKIFLNEKVTTNAEGSSFYKRTQEIPVKAGDIIYVGVGEPAWPSMNNQGSESRDYIAAWYTIKIEIEGETPGNNNPPGGGAVIEEELTIGSDDIPLAGVSFVALEGVVKGSAMTISVTPDIGAKLRDDAKAKAEIFGKDTVLILAPKSEVEINSYTLIIPAAELALFKGMDISGVTRLGNISLPASLVDKLIAQGKELRVTIEKGSLIVKLTLGNTEVNLKQLGERILLEMPYTPADGENTATVVMYKVDGNKKNVITDSRYSGGYVKAYAATTGRFEAMANTKNFTDTQGKWMDDAALYLAAREIVSGVGDGLFAPDTNMTRAMLVTVLYHYEGVPAVSGANPFMDVEDGQWYTDAVKWAQQNSIVTGYGGETFGPHDNITREQLAVILKNYSTEKGWDTSKVSDLDGYTDMDAISDWSMDAVKWANAEGLMNGRTQTTLAPKGTATRGEAAQMLMNFIEKYVRLQQK